MSRELDLETLRRSDSPDSTPVATLSTPHLSDNSQEMDERIKDKDEPASPTDKQEDSRKEAGTKQGESKDVKTKSKSSKSDSKKKKSKGTKDTKRKKKVAVESDTSSDSSTSESDSDEDDSSDDSDEYERSKAKRRLLKNKSRSTKSKKLSKKRKGTSEDSESSDDSSSEDSSASDKQRKRRAKSSKSKSKRKVKSKREAVESSSESSSSEGDEPSSKKGAKRKVAAPSDSADSSADEADPSTEVTLDTLAALLKAYKGTKSSSITKITDTTKRKSKSHKRETAKRKSSKKSDALQYKRVDQLWDLTTHNYKLKESAKDEEGEFSEFAFLVRRKFDWENKYTHTVIDIKSKQLRAVLVEVMKECKSVSLEAEEPVIDPNLLFLYLEQLRKFYRKTAKSRIRKARKRKTIKKLEQQRSLCKVLVSWIDEDYADTKKTLYPLLKAGNITFDLLWALFNPNDIAITSCYGSWDEPRCFKIDYALKYQTMTRGEWYCVEGKYMEYDGKNFGYGDFEVDIEAFKGPRKIASLATYPLKYHKDAEGVKKQIIERGEKFVAMDGMQYQFHKGLAFMKKRKQVLKISINSRIMVDPATFRRINPNYPISLIKPKWADLDSDDDDSDDASSCGCGGSDNDETVDKGGSSKVAQDEDAPRYKHKWVEDADGDIHYVRVEVDENGDPVRNQRVDQLANSPEAKNHIFTKDELLLTSPVVVGFAFSEKLWLEFSISGIHDIDYNEDAFDSLVLPDKEKSIVRALVESHKFHAAKTIDDVIQGKGKGLVSVLHGPPGTGKTLTAEGISELLKCPLYMVSAGELGTDPAKLEHELQKILDIAHSWGAVLLLDEADVFLEKRQTHDIHRNALVSIFLRLLEYFQGILFLTTNRVESFDDAFQSRIHLALRYSDLDSKAKTAIWKTHLQRVRDSHMTVTLKDHELESLARHNLNGRQIKNVVRTAQALALSEKTALKLEHIKQVLDVQETFERDLKGGTGYLDAMRSYT